MDPEHNFSNKIVFPIAKHSVFDRKIHMLAIVKESSNRKCFFDINTRVVPESRRLLL